VDKVGGCHLSKSIYWGRVGVEIGREREKSGARVGQALLLISRFSSGYVEARRLVASLLLENLTWAMEGHGGEWSGRKWMRVEVR